MLLTRQPIPISLSKIPLHFTAGKNRDIANESIEKIKDFLE